MRKTRFEKAKDIVIKPVKVKKRLFEGKDPTTYFRELRERHSKQISHQ